MLNSSKNTVREAEVTGNRPRTRPSRRWQPSSQTVFGLSARRSSSSRPEHGPLRQKLRTALQGAKAQVEKVYRQSMSALVAVDDVREVAAKRELYRRLARASDDLREVAERVWYSVLKES